MIRSACLILIALLFQECSSKQSISEMLSGKWKMSGVYEYGRDVTSVHNPKDNRWIEFNSDGTFVSDGDPFGRNTGRWHVDEKKSILYIDSDVDDDDSEWNLVIESDKMTWTGIGHPRKENTMLVHTR